MNRYYLGAVSIIVFGIFLMIWKPALLFIATEPGWTLVLLGVFILLGLYASQVYLDYLKIQENEKAEQEGWKNAGEAKHGEWYGVCIGRLKQEGFNDKRWMHNHCMNYAENEKYRN